MPGPETRQHTVQLTDALTECLRYVQYSCMEERSRLNILILESYFLIKPQLCSLTVAHVRNHDRVKLSAIYDVFFVSVIHSWVIYSCYHSVEL